MQKKTRLVNAKEMLNKAYKHRYAIGHFNINNLEWTEAILSTAQETKTPVILGVSEGALKYMGGFDTVTGIVNGLMEFYNVTVPVALHLDHGQSVEVCKQAIDAGFTSVMYDGSHEKLDVNLKNTEEVVEYAKKANVSVEAEVGSIGGEEDGIIAEGETASVNDAKALASKGIDVLAAGIGNIHGVYPADWTGLHFDALKNISGTVKMPMVLHGGSGIPKEQVIKAISLGITKVNVNTECQIVWAAAVRKYFEANKDKQPKGFDPRKVLKPGSIAIKAEVKKLMQQFGSLGKA